MTQFWDWMMKAPEGLWGFIGAIAGGAIAYLIAWHQMRSNAAASSVDHFRDQFRTALAYFSGGSQRRNIGISILASLWDHPLAHSQSDIYQKSCALLFCNQSIYLLRQGKNRFEGHEQDNLRRMMRVVLGFKNFREPDKYANQKHDLLASIPIYRNDASLENRSAALGRLTIDLDRWEAELASLSR